VIALAKVCANGEDHEHEEGGDGCFFVELPVYGYSQQ
jgi:hypothetical protein